MKFNYAQAKKEFEAEWAEIEKICRCEGMKDSDLALLREFYLAEFNSNRRNSRYQACGVDYLDLISNPEDRETNYGISLAVQYDCFDGHSRYWWIETIADERLEKRVSSLSIYEKELLTLKFKEERTYKEMSTILHIPMPTVISQVKKLCNMLGGTV